MKYNQDDYRWYVISDRGIESGWEYKEDAQDFKREMGGFLYSKKTLISKGLDPDDDASWATGIPEPLKGFSEEEILSLAHSLKPKAGVREAQHHVATKGKRRHAEVTAKDIVRGAGLRQKRGES